MSKKSKSSNEQKQETITVEKAVETVDIAISDETSTEVVNQPKPGEGQVSVDSEYLKTTRVHFAVMCNHGLITEAAFVSFLKFAGIARQLGMEWTVETVSNDPLISRARNTLVAKFLSQPDSTHLIFVDGDISWEPWQLLVLVDRKLDMVGGLYSSKNLPIRWMVNTFEGAEETDDGLHEVNRIGCGFLVVKREVFDKLSSHASVKPYINDIGLNSKVEPYLRTYFQAEVKDGMYVSEDWAFCDNWVSVGGKIYVDKRVMVGAVGQFNYSAQTQDQILNTFGPQYVDFMKSRGVLSLNESIVSV